MACSRSSCGTRSSGAGTNSRSSSKTTVRACPRSSCRDPLGVKPFAYAWDGVEFIFASEARVVARARGLPVRAHEDAVLEYLVAPCFSGVERPMFAGVEYLQ